MLSPPTYLLLPKFGLAPDGSPPNASAATLASSSMPMPTAATTMLLGTTTALRSASTSSVLTCAPAGSPRGAPSPVNRNATPCARSLRQGRAGAADSASTASPMSYSERRAAQMPSARSCTTSPALALSTFAVYEKLSRFAAARTCAPVCSSMRT
eukprot:Amastigsp_a5714_17.p4 type:complete len:155 gc:universal Amastigsp_a5714_17:822-358(-)